MVISVESVLANIAQLKSLALSGLLKRVIIDEAHLLLTSSHFRDAVNDLSILSTLGCPIHCLSGTLSPKSEDALMSKLGIVNYQVLRSPLHHSTTRLLRCHTCRTSRGSEYLTAPCFSQREDGSQRWKGSPPSLFVRKPKQRRCRPSWGDRWAIYTGRMNPVERAQVMADLVDGKYDGVVGTSALSTGIDLTSLNSLFFWRSRTI